MTTIPDIIDNELMVLDEENKQNNEVVDMIKLEKLNRGSSVEKNFKETTRKKSSAKHEDSNKKLQNMERVTNQMDDDLN